MRALWGRGSINLFTFAVFHKEKTKSMLYSTYYKGKDRSTVGVFLHDLYSKQLLMNRNTQKLFGQIGPLQNLSIN